jgi:hypothetical protein
MSDKIVVLPTRPKRSESLKHYIDAADAEAHFALLEQLLTTARLEGRQLNQAQHDARAQLAEALAQRDAAREFIVRIATVGAGIEGYGAYDPIQNYLIDTVLSFRFRAEQAEADLATEREFDEVTRGVLSVQQAEATAWRERALNAERSLNYGRGDTVAERSIDL